MTNAKITSLAELSTTPANGDMLVIVDVSDTSMNGTGTNKKIAADMFVRTDGNTNTLTTDLDLSDNQILDVSGLAIGTASTGQLLEVVGSLGGCAVDSTGVTLSMTRASNNYIKASETGGAIAFIANGAANSGANSSIFLSTTSQRVGIAGNSSPSYALDVSGQAHASSFPTSSDIRLKENINRLELTNNLKQKLSQINAYTFKWKDGYSGVEHFKRGDGRTKDLQVGFIAQEVKEAVPQLVTTWRHAKQEGEDEDGNAIETNVIEDALAVDYTRFIPILWEAVKELYQENAELKQRVAALEA